MSGGKMIRNIFVVVFFNFKLPIEKNSSRDIELLRASHRAHIRKQDGIIDTFLFIICTDTPQDKVIQSISSYGFPDKNIIIIEDNDEQDYDKLRELIGYELSDWIDKNHPSAITKLSVGSDYEIDFWWTGIEGAEDECINFIVTENYASLLPETHISKASTWLAILNDLFYSKGNDSWLEENKFAIQAAALCEWLHGFEAASGNSYNYFDVNSVCEGISLRDIYLGYMLGKSNPGDSLEEICVEYDKEPNIREEVFNHLLPKLRLIIRENLSNFFGSDTELFWSLYSAIWPKYDEPSVEACNSLMNLEVGNIGDYEPLWEFVSYGWCDDADS